MALAFTKWQGCGNDFVLMDARETFPNDPAGLSQRICDRHYGVGADGLIFVLPSSRADLCMRIFNADGSEAEMCGNGIRCFARLAYETGMTTKEKFTVETGAGILLPRIVLENGCVTGVEVDMGTPTLAAEKIPVAGFGSERVVDQEIEVLGGTYKVTCVSMGNPHCVVFVDDAEAVDMERLGPAFERHAWFPKRTNVEFVQAMSDGSLRMRVWERGAAVTLACGTGACASLVAASLTGRLKQTSTKRSAVVQLDGGRLFIDWAEDDHIYMTGPAESVFTGVYEE